MPRSRQDILLNFKLTNEAKRANLNKNKRIFKWRPFWNKVYSCIRNEFNKTFELGRGKLAIVFHMMSRLPSWRSETNLKQHPC